MSRSPNNCPFGDIKMGIAASGAILLKRQLAFFRAFASRTFPLSSRPLSERSRAAVPAASPALFDIRKRSGVQLCGNGVNRRAASAIKDPPPPPPKPVYTLRLISKLSHGKKKNILISLSEDQRPSADAVTDGVPVPLTFESEDKTHRRNRAGVSGRVRRAPNRLNGGRWRA